MADDFELDIHGKSITATEFVMAIQDKLINIYRTENPLECEDEQAIIDKIKELSNKKLMEYLNKSEPDWGLLFCDNRVTNYCKYIISRRTNEDSDDVWSEFIEKKAARGIVSFKDTKNISFKRFLNKPLTNHIIDHYNKNKKKLVTVSTEVITDEGFNPSEFKRIEKLENIIQCMDYELNNSTQNKLIFHSELLDVLFRYHRHDLLIEWKGKTYIETTKLIEEKYSSSNALGTRTSFLQGIRQKIKNDAEENRIFLEDIDDLSTKIGRQRINERICGIYKSFSKRKANGGNNE